LDESGYNLTPTIIRSWALKGNRPVISHSWGSRKKLSVISGIALKHVDHKIDTSLYFRIYPGRTITAIEVVEFLYQLNRQIKGNIILVWDNLNAHKANRVKRYVARKSNFESILLPPYCPELNPDESVWYWTKLKDMVNYCPENFCELVHRVRSSLRKIQRRKSLQMWCLRESELPWDSLLN
jgi:transposase